MKELKIKSLDSSIFTGLKAKEKMSKRMQILNHNKTEIIMLSFFRIMNPLMPTKRIFFSFLILFTIIITGSLSAHSQEKDQFVLVIDAGHGGKDPGTQGVKSYEKDIALAIALKFGAYVEERLKDVKVIYTRKTDVFIELHERANIANRNRADLFVSIHVDGVENKKVSGTSTFVMGLHKNDENLAVAKRENAVIMKEEDYNQQYDGFDPASPESYIRISLEQNASLDLSLSLAAQVQDQFENRVKRKSRGVKQAGFLVLWKTTMPSILVETGFLTNRAEESFLNTTDGQDYMASAIYRAFLVYKKDVESKTAVIVEQEVEEAVVEDPCAGTVFRVQVAASPKPIDLKSSSLKKLENIVEHKENNVYKYTVGCEKDYEKILKLHKQVKVDVKDAFVVAYKDGEKYSVRKARSELKN